MAERGDMLPYFNAGAPALAVQTMEEAPLIMWLLANTNYETYWRKSAMPGIEILAERAGTASRKSKLGQHKMLDAKADVVTTLQKLRGQRRTALILEDFADMATMALPRRALMDGLYEYSSTGSVVIMVAPRWRLPAELQHLIPVIDWLLPKRDEMEGILDKVEMYLSAAKDKKAKTKTSFSVPEERRPNIIDSMMGLGTMEAENSLCMAARMTDLQTIHPEDVFKLKAKRLKEQGLLDYQPPVSVNNMGGLGNLKEYFKTEVIPRKRHAKLRVRGLLLVGVPGTGKSLAAKVAGSILERPVFHMQIGRLKGSYVGQSEANMARALEVANAMPCVLWMDEIEKALGGVASSNMTDGGTLDAMFGMLLTWLSDHNENAMVVATCNNFSKLEIELTRKGRFDEIFFVDLPTLIEREEIAAVHLARLDCPVELAQQISELTETFTGAEIEHLVKSLATAQLRGEEVKPGTKKTDKLLLGLKDACRPLAETRAEEIGQLRAWASRTAQPANTPEAHVQLERELLE